MSRKLLSIALVLIIGRSCESAHRRDLQFEIPWQAPVPIVSPPLSAHAPEPGSMPNGIKAAYWPSGDGFPASSIDASYFTHIYYAFLLPEPETYKLNITPLDQLKLPELASAMQQQNMPIKTLISIGGGASNSTVFSRMASSKITRPVFINSTIEVARTYGYDGVDLDWEFPANSIDMSNLAVLIKEWRRAVAHEAKQSGKPRLLLTSAVYYSSSFQVYGEHRSYPGKAIRKYMDWVSPMCFDYHGSLENFTGAQSALYDPNSNISTSYGIRSWIEEAGVPPEKLVMGLPLYGRTWTLQDPNVNGIGAPAIGEGPGENGTLTYSQIIDYNVENNPTIKFDSVTVSYYSYANVNWIGYDDISSVEKKVHFARSQGLGGYFFWALGQDKGWTISQHALEAWDNQLQGYP